MRFNAPKKKKVGLPCATSKAPQSTFPSTLGVPNVRVNDVALRSLQIPERGQLDYWDSGLPGSGCRVSQGGSKTFLLKHDNRRITIGRYPIIPGCAW